MKFFFRVDSSHQIGSGHMMRCLVLADALRKQGHDAVFICRDLPGNYIYVAKNNNFPVIILPYSPQNIPPHYNHHQQWLGVPKEIDLQQMLALISNESTIDWLIVDHYGLDNEWESACRPHIKNLMVIDDLADRTHDCDLLLDQNFYIAPDKRYNHLLPAHCKCLIGPAYALLRSEFKEAKKNLLPHTGKVKRLLVFLGGNDSHNATQKILDAIQQSDCHDLPVDLILGASNKYKDELQALCANKKNYNLHCPATNMAELMSKADLALGAGGTTTWERCCLGLPSLIVKIAENQDELIRQGLLADLFDYIGEILTLDANGITKKINLIIKDPIKLQTMSKNGMQLVDGLGAERVVKEILAF